MRRTRCFRSCVRRDGVEDAAPGARSPYRLARARSPAAPRPSRRRTTARSCRRWASPASSSVCMICITTCGSSRRRGRGDVAHRVRQLVGIHHGTILARWRNVARTVAACVVIEGEPSALHFGAVTARGELPISNALRQSRAGAAAAPHRRHCGPRRSSSPASARFVALLDLVLDGPVLEVFS